MKQGKKDEAEQAKQQVAALKGEQKDVADSLADTERRMREILLTVPNIPCEAVWLTGLAPRTMWWSLPEVRCPISAPTPCPTGILQKKYDLIDFDLGVKIT